MSTGDVYGQWGKRRVLRVEVDPVTSIAGILMQLGKDAGC